MGNITGQYRAINFTDGSIPVIELDGMSSTYDIVPSEEESWVFPFNNLVTFTIPPYTGSITNIFSKVDTNGHRWNIGLYWSGDPFILWYRFEIEGVGYIQDVFTPTISQSMVGVRGILYCTHTPQLISGLSVGFHLVLSMAKAQTSYPSNAAFANGRTLSPSDSGSTSFPAGTSVDNFTSSQSKYYYINSYSNGIKIEGHYQGSLMAPVTLTKADIIITRGTQSILYNYIYNGSTPEPILPPYYKIEDSDKDGNDGTYDFESTDDIDFPSLPQISANVAGFISLWSPRNDQLLSLASYLWNDDVLSSNFWKKLIANPIDLIFGLSIIPLDLTDYIDGTYSVVVGLVDTKIRMRHLNTQWVSFDCGEIDLSETWGAYLDYDPFTKLEIYLPFCGTHPLKVDDFMPGKIRVVYHIDLLTGSCIAMVKSTKTNRHNDVLNSVIYQFMGNCATQIPVSSQQFADAVRSAVSIAASIGTMIATGVGGSATASSMFHTGASAVENVMNIKPSIERTGAMGSSGSLLAVRKPYIILTRPRQAKPDEQFVYTGYPSFITETLGDLKGWTIVQAIHLDNIPCTSDEMNEIDELLKGGVIF